MRISIHRPLAALLCSFALSGAPAGVSAEPSRDGGAPPETKCSAATEQSLTECFTGLRPRTDACFQGARAAWAHLPAGTKFRLSVEYVIDTDGAVKSVKFLDKDGDFKDAGTRACLEGVIRGIRFEAVGPRQKRTRVRTFNWQI